MADRRPPFIVEVTDSHGFYRACWPREAGTPSSRTLAEYVRLTEAQEQVTVLRATVRRNIIADRMVVADYNVTPAPAFVAAW